MEITTLQKTILDPRKAFLKRWNVGFVLSCVIAISLDPLFFYLPVINEEKKCIRLDKKLWITAIVLQSFFNIIYLMHIILQFRTSFIGKKLLKSGKSELNTDAWKIAQKYLWMWFLFDIMCVFGYQWKIKIILLFSLFLLLFMGLTALLGKVFKPGPFIEP